MRLRVPARASALAAVPFLLAVVLLAPATVGGRVLAAADIPLDAAPFPPQPAPPQNPLQFDAGVVFEPDGLLVREALRDLRLPVWTPWQSAGRPLLAAQQSAPLFPLTWLSAILPYWTSLAWIAVLELTLAGLGTALLARALGLRTGPALLAAVAFAFGTYLVSWLQHPHANAYVLLPWLLLCAERLCRRAAPAGRASVRDAALLGLVSGVAWLSGQPESAALVCLTAAAWIVHRLATAGLDRRELARRGLLAAAAGAGGLAVGAAMLVPLVEALGQASEASRAQPPLALRSIVTLVAPEYWGRPDRVEVAGGPLNFTERTLYVGALPVLLAAAGLARRPRGPWLFLLALTVVALAVSLDTGPIATTAAALPGLDRINVTRALVLASFGIAMLAGHGLQRLLDGGPAERRRIVVVAAALAALPVLGALAAHPGWLGATGDALRRLAGRPGPASADAVALASVLRWLLAAAVSVAVLAALAGARRRTWPVAAAIAVAAADLLVMGWGYNPAITRAQAEPPAPPAVQAMRRLTAGGGRVAGFGGLEPNTASRWRLADASGHEQPQVRRTADLWSALGGWGYGTPANAALDPRAPRALAVFGVRALLVSSPARRAPAPALPAPVRRWPVAYAGPGGTVLENPNALPEAFVAYDWRPVRRREEALLLTAARPPRATRDRPTIETAAAPPAGASPAATPARVVRRSDTETTVEADAVRPGRLVLLDGAYPGWRAEVDGRAVPIEAAAAAFRAVAVPAGRHTVRFRYRPASVTAGAAITLAALALLVAASALGRPRHSPA